jgi:hypothetical protein
MSTAPEPAKKKKETAEDRFDRDIPKEDQDNVMECIVEAAHDPENKAEVVTFIDTVQLNITNVEAEGVIELNGVEHTFHIRSGDCNGTELLGWNDDSEIDHSPPIPRALVPHRNRIMAAIADNQALAFIQAWDRDLQPGNERGDVLHHLVSKQAYDAFFDPRPSAHRYDKIANEYGYEILDGPDEKRVRTLLYFHASTLIPTHDFLKDKPPIEALQAWNDALKNSECKGIKPGEQKHEVFEARVAAARTLANTAPDRHGVRPSTPRADDLMKMRAFGFDLVRPGIAFQKRHELLLKCFKLEPIEGFDPETLPENPVAGLFKVFDPELVSDTKVNPLYEASECVFYACRNMARGQELELPEHVHERLATYGFRAPRIDQVPEHEPQLELEENIGPAM